jgi:membrane-associated phospholipid phosphatase
MKGSLLLACALSLALPLTAEEPPASPQAQPMPDGRRTGGRFLVNYGRDLVGVVSKDNLKPFVIIAGVTGVGAFFDDNVQKYFSEERRAKWLGDAGQTLGQPVVIAPMALALFGLGRLNHHQSFRDATYDVAEVTLVAATYTTALKYTTRRERPDGSNNQSFPSGHTSNAFAWATIGAHYYGWKLGVPGYAVASLIGISRMEKNVHYLSDVLAGAGLGYLSARSVMRKNSQPMTPAPARTTRLSFAPMADPRGQGIGLQASLTF